MKLRNGLGLLGFGLVSGLLADLAYQHYSAISILQSIVTDAVRLCTYQK